MTAAEGDEQQRCDRDDCDSRHCQTCGTCKGIRVEQYVPTASGPGTTRTLCTLCLMLPTDPQVVPDVVDEILARKAARS